MEKLGDKETAYIQTDGYYLENGGWKQYMPQVYVTGESGNLEKLSTKAMPQSLIGEFIEKPETKKVNFVSYEQASLRLTKKYGEIPNMRQHIFKHDLVSFCKKIGVDLGNGLNLDRLKNLKIVDFGCGIERLDTYDEEYDYRPWLCRLLHELGADVCGMDLYLPRINKDGNRETEDWPFFQANLLEDTALDDFSKNSIDLVNTNLLVGHDERLLTSPSMYQHALDSNEYRKMEETIFRQALKILKPGGALLVNYEYLYKKVGGPMIFSLEMIDKENGVRDPEIMRRVKSYSYADGSFLGVE